MSANWYYNDDGDNVGDTSWDYYNPDVMESMGFEWEEYDGWNEEDS